MRAQCGDLAFEVLGRAESAVHRGETQVRDLVQVAEWAKDGQTDLIAGNFRGSGRPDGVLDLLSKQIQRVVIDVAALAGTAYTLDDLVAAERLGNTAALHDGEHSGLHGGETTATFRARSTSPYRLTLIRLTGIDYARVWMPAERTVHYCSFAGSGLQVVGLGELTHSATRPDRCRGYPCSRTFEGHARSPISRPEKPASDRLALSPSRVH